MFSQSFLDELTARNDIADVVGSYVNLMPKGGNLWACCPFHNEKTPSFSVSPGKQIYHCFGCKKGGGVINFVMEMENLSFPDAVQFLAKRVNMEVPVEDGNDAATRQRSRLLDLNRDAARYYYEVLQSPAGAAVQAYLDKRMIRKNIAVRFGMGASTPEWDGLIRAMTAKGYTKAELLKAGLAVQNKHGGLYDFFRNRLILPVIDIRGDVVGFGSRVIIAEDSPKYKNTNETPVYAKRKVLYGLNLAKKTKRPNIILCEGNLDVVTLHQAGFDNAVASMGTALTVEQTRLLSRYTKELVLCYDNDNAGQMATQRVLEMLRNSEFTVKVLKLPNKMVDGQSQKQDADDFIKAYGADAFENLLSGSENGIEFRMAQVQGKYDLGDDRQKIAYATEISDVLCTLENAVERDVYTVRAAEAVGLPADAMRSEVNRAFKRRMSKDKKTRERRELSPSLTNQPSERGIRYENLKSAMAEEGVIRLLYQDESLFPDESPLSEADFSSPLLWRIYSQLWENRTRTHNLSGLSAVLSGEEMSHLTTILQKPESTANGPQALQDYFAIIRQECRKRHSADPLLQAMNTMQKKKTYGGKHT